MAHTFIEHIAGKVVQRIVLTNDPDAHEIEIQFQDRTGFPHSVGRLDAS